MRLFTGLSLPPEARSSLLALTGRLRPLAKLAWTSEDKLHITTKFIGEWPESRVDELKQVLTAVAAPGPVQIHIRGLGWMPNERRPLTLYAGVEHDASLAALAQATDHALFSLGILPEKRAYHPHVTLGRIRRQEKDDIRALRDEVAGATLDLAPFIAGAFHLYLSADGTYTRLSTYPLHP